MTLSTYFPAAFPALALAHLLALLSPGQDFFLIVANSIKHKFKGSRFICLGVAIGNAVYIVLAIVGWTAIRDNGLVYFWVELFGALYLVWLGTMLLKSQKSECGSELLEAPIALKQLVLGFNSALLNPKNALFYMSLMTVILGNDVTFVQQVSCGLWMFFAVLFWNLLVALFIGQPRVQDRLSAYIHLIERVAGIVLISFAMVIFVSYF